MIVHLRERRGWIVWLSFWMILSGCAAVMPAPVTKPPEATSPLTTEEPLSSEMKSDPRAIASLQFTEQGRMLLESGHPEEAITILERALSLYPNNGQNYYYLAEAWLAKGDILQADEWNRLAGTYLLDDSAWIKRVRKQRARIRKFIK